jgi:O-antigen ligase
VTETLAARRPAGALARAGSALRSVDLPALALALSVNGFFLYLAVLDVLNVTPRTAITATYYAVVGALMVTLAWRSRDVVAARLRSASRVPRAYALVAAALAAWYLANVALLSEGTLSRKFAALLVLWSLPSALLAASLTRRQVDAFVRGLFALGLVFCVFELVALLRNSPDANRYSPIADLDPISAGLIPATAAIAALALRPGDRRGRMLQLTAFAALVAATVLPGSRSPVLSLLVGGGLVAVFAWRRLGPAVLAALAIGLAAGWLLSRAVGSAGYYTTGVPGFGTTATTQPISTFNLRREWWTTAIKDIPDRPIFGHGVAMLRDETPEARRMGIAGERISVHNALIESAYSLGAIGFALYVTLLALVVVALVRLRGRFRADAAVLFALAFSAFALVNANVSGQIGDDGVGWAAATLAVALYADTRRRVAAA